MDDSDAPTNGAIGTPLLNWPGGNVSVMTTGFQEYEDFTAVTRLCGRQTHCETLQAAFTRASSGVSEVVLVHGASGTGKSSLIDSMRDIVTNENGGYFVSGKFDQLQTTKEPCSAIAATFSDICDLILQCDHVAEQREAIATALGSESTILSRVVSNITTVTGEEIEEKGHLGISSENSSRFKLVCQTFLRTVASEAHPLLIFFDDLQWADELSIELIKAFISDASSRHILLCVAYRGDECDGKALLDLTEGGRSNQLAYTELEVKNLDDADLSSMLVQLLHMDSTSLVPLTNLLLEKTMGNPQAVVQLLQHLHQNQLLTFSNESYNWEWNIDVIEAEVSDNPNEVIAHKVDSLGYEVKEILKLAAYVGHSFDIDVLLCLLYQCDDPNENTLSQSAKCQEEAELAELRKSLQIAISKGLILVAGRGDKQFRFTHDSHQRFLYNMIEDATEQEHMYLRIGRGVSQLVRCGTIPNHERLIFLAASNLTRGARLITDDDERIASMRLLLDTANLAASKASLNSAREYLECCVNLMKESDWLAHYSLCIDIYNSMGEVQSSSGFFDESDASIEIVLDRARFMNDRMRAHCTKIRCFGYRKDLDRMLDWAFTVLKQLGESMPKQPSLGTLGVELLRTKMVTKKVPPENFLSLPKMKDENKLAAMKVFRIIGPVIFMGYPTTYLYTILRQIRLCVQYGVSPITASSLGAYAVALRAMGNAEYAYRFAIVAVELASRDISTATTKSLTLFATSAFILPMRIHLFKLVDQMLESYACGVKSSSDLTVAFYGLTGYLEARHHLGTPLAELEVEMRRYCQQMKDWQAYQMWSFNVIEWQYVLNLLGQSDDPLVLTGEAMDEREHLEAVERQGLDAVHRVLNFNRFLLLMSFECWDSIAVMLPQLIKDLPKQHFHFNQYMYTTQIIIAALVLFDATGARKYRRMARTHMKLMKKWFVNVPDVESLWMLIDAEWSAITDKKESSDGFDAAIDSLKHSRLIVFETMAYQRAMHFMLKTLNVRKARGYLVKSIARHREWGNMAKVEWLEATYSTVLRSERPAYEVDLTVSQQSASPGNMQPLFFGIN